MIARAWCRVGWLLTLFFPLAATATPAKRYAEPQRASGKRAAICVRVEALASSLQPGLVADARLAAAAEEVLQHLPVTGRPGNDLVEAALWLHGLVEPPPHLLVAAMSPGGDEALIDELRVQLPRAFGQGHFVRMGVASEPMGSEVRVLVALQETHLQLRPVLRALPAGGSAVLEARLVDGYRRGAAFVTLPDGSVEHLAVQRSDDSHLRATMRCSARAGRHQVEITGEERYGPAVVANFPVWCGVPAPIIMPAASAAVVAETTPQAAEAEMLRLVNRDRARARLPALISDALLGRVARAHSADMRVHDFVGHVSPTTGSANDRLRGAGITPQLVLENVARAYSAQEAEEGLMGSPGHRANLLHAGVTKIGIGVEIGDGVGGRELWVTQVFVKPVDHIDGGSGRILLTQLATLRREKGLTALLGDDELDEVAKKAAADMADGQDPARVSATVDQVLGKLGRRFGSVKSVVAVAGGTDQLVSGVRQSALEAGLTHVGIGMQEGKRKDGSSALYGVFLLAVQR